ncbi:hypothetical protein AYI68_g5095 [Smittium mucronatum]|uniref:Uncharacterized protein n=1 Tax=Smittium mucronatum TaxID=133383 RepID=A0A1R0GV84_9FUNG|nr:hypothetical protein AYI68_g5095 [Smittium mucronatum]
MVKAHTLLLALCGALTHISANENGYDNFKNTDLHCRNGDCGLDSYALEKMADHNIPAITQEDQFKDNDSDSEVQVKRRRKCRKVKKRRGCRRVRRKNRCRRLRKRKSRCRKVGRRKNRCRRVRKRIHNKRAPRRRVHKGRRAKNLRHKRRGHKKRCPRKNKNRRHLKARKELDAVENVQLASQTTPIDPDAIATPTPLAAPDASNAQVTPEDSAVSTTAPADTD